MIATPRDLIDGGAKRAYDYCWANDRADGDHQEPTARGRVRRSRRPHACRLWEWGRGGVRLVLTVASVLCAIALPLGVITSVVLALMFDAGYFEGGQRRYQVDQTTGFTFEQIGQIDRGIVRFFGTSESLPTALAAVGANPDVFQDKEVLHMNDVRLIVWFMQRVQVVTLAFFAIFVVVSLLTWRQGGLGALTLALIASAVVTVGLGIVVGLLTYFEFDQLFLAFHETVFQNNFWQLDPRTDHLIQLFPFEFWYDAMLTVAIRVVLVVIALGVVGAVLGRVEGRRV
jgi:integral membrane protein (TIGR01906 family)